MIILGIHELCHDISSALVIDGKLKSAVEEERFTRNKHQWGLSLGGRAPINSIGYCLKNSRLSLEDVDCIAYSFKTISFLFNFKSAHNTSKFISMRNLKKAGFRVNTTLHSLLGTGPVKRYFFRRNLNKKVDKNMFLKHHLCHASSSFRVSGFKKSNILVIDGKGESESTSLFVGEDDEIKFLKSFNIPNSLGELYRVLTYVLGFGDGGEGKTMALASYGKINSKHSEIVKISKHDYRIMHSMVKRLGRFIRPPKERVLDVHKNIAATLQARVEEAVLELVDYLYDSTGYKKLCLAGGVALNCKLNGRLLKESPINNIYVQPAANDAGSALGAALEASAQLGYKCKTKMKHVYWGPEYSNNEIKRELDKHKLNYEYYDDISGVGAELIAKGNIMGWFQGRMEFGPRALGNRSILANPTDPKMRDKVNKIKNKELWRPLAPSIIAESAKEYLEKPYPSPFMILSFQVKEKKRREIPAVVHVDGSTRPQTVTKKVNPKFYKLIKKFENEEGVPLVLNTSFNLAGEPIVCSPKDAIETFKKTTLDYLAIGNYLVSN